MMHSHSRAMQGCSLRGFKFEIGRKIEQKCDLESSQKITTRQTKYSVSLLDSELVRPPSRVSLLFQLFEIY